MESVGELALDLVLKGGKPLPLGEQTTSTLTQGSNPGKSRDYQSPRYLSRLFAGAAELVAVAVTPCSAPPAVAGTMSLTGQEKFETAPTDKRFPTTNQAKHCYM